MLLAAMLAMVLAAAVPAFAQSASAQAQNQVAVGGSGGDIIQQCQNNLNQAAFQDVDANAVSGDANADAVAINDGTLVNECVQDVNEGDTFIDRDVTVVGFTEFEEVEQTVFFDVEQNFFFIIVEGDEIVIEKNLVVFTVEIEDEDVVSSDVSVVSSDVAATETEVLPETGGASLLALGAGALLVAGGLLARRIVR